MSKRSLTLTVLFVLYSMGCGLLAQSAAQPPAAISTQTASLATPATQQVLATPSAQATDLPAASPTPTANPPSATPDSAFATSQAEAISMVGSMGILMNAAQYYDPVGTPLQSWNGVPIMSQATAGQEFNPNVYSYIASATLEQARQFYQAKAAALGIVNPPATGFSGSGDQASHSVSFFSYELSILLNSFDNDTNHVIVVIGKMQ